MMPIDRIHRIRAHLRGNNVGNFDYSIYRGLCRALLRLVLTYRGSVGTRDGVLPAATFLYDRSHQQGFANSHIDNWDKYFEDHEKATSAIAGIINCWRIDDRLAEILIWIPISENASPTLPLGDVTNVLSEIETQLGI